MNLQTILAGAILLLLNVPFLQAPLGYHILKPLAALGLGWGVLTLLGERTRDVSWNREFTLFCLLFGIIWAYALIIPDNLRVWDTNLERLAISTVGITLCYAIGVVHSTELGRETQHLLRLLLVLAVGANAAICIPALMSGELVAREFINDSEVIGTRTSIFEYGLGNLGTYCAMALLCPVALTGITRGRTVGAKVVWVLAGLAMLACLLLSSLLAVVLAAASALAVCLVLSARLRQGRLALTFGLSILVGASFFLTKDLPAVHFARDKVLALLRDESGDEVAAGRNEKRQGRYEDSWETMRDHPIAGLGDVPADSMDRKTYTLGGHSGFLDGFAMFGLLFAPFPLLIVRKAWVAWMRVKDPKLAIEGGLELAVIAAYGLLAILDPIMMDIKVTGVFLFLLGSQTVYRVAPEESPEPRRHSWAGDPRKGRRMREAVAHE
ncbi:MAG: O-antigen ligase family protein [Terriglobia bacterium]